MLRDWAAQGYYATQYALESPELPYFSTDPALAYRAAPDYDWPPVLISIGGRSLDELRQPQAERPAVASPWSLNFQWPSLSLPWWAYAVAGAFVVGLIVRGR